MVPVSGGGTRLARRNGQRVFPADAIPLQCPPTWTPPVAPPGKRYIRAEGDRNRWWLWRLKMCMETSLSIQSCLRSRLSWACLTAGVVLALAGCSSSARHAPSSTYATHRTTTTTVRPEVPPPPPNAAAIATYLNAPGNALVVFERSTTTLGAGHILSKSECQGIAKSFVPGSGSDPSAVTAAIRLIANTAIQVAASQDLQAKLLLLGACTQGSATQKMANAAAASSSVIDTELRQLGISL